MITHAIRGAPAPDTQNLAPDVGIEFTRLSEGIALSLLRLCYNYRPFGSSAASRIFERNMPVSIMCLGLRPAAQLQTSTLCAFLSEHGHAGVSLL